MRGLTPARCNGGPNLAIYPPKAFLFSVNDHQTCPKIKMGETRVAMFSLPLGRRTSRPPTMIAGGTADQVVLKMPTPDRRRHDPVRLGCRPGWRSARSACIAG